MMEYVEYINLLFFIKNLYFAFRLLYTINMVLTEDLLKNKFSEMDIQNFQSALTSSRQRVYTFDTNGLSFDSLYKYLNYHGFETTIEMDNSTCRSMFRCTARINNNFTYIISALIIALVWALVYLIQ